METTETIAINNYTYMDLLEKKTQLGVIVRLAKASESLASDDILRIAGVKRDKDQEE
ncbi:MAG TPA: hypothetical protein H9735_04365 [Candidatus Anaerostipes excrementavium]|uniref:Uncharacterized protein n=1 Tax=Candidatus Anaerostipes excrementavium TaxID=2838463 RepID=A0A9D2B8Z9_9FIRM|nr:hypothetical protein [uncultured Anaerostipes sp.]HIX67348.1 hypothetical protein [Candidatus Anaerostipes excrementavium]